MDTLSNCLVIEGSNRLNGEVSVHGAKNSALPILAATILVNGECVLHNCPNLTDIDATIKILRHLGCKVTRENDTVTVNARDISCYDVPDSLMREMRSSIIFLGAILGRCSKARLSYPGGCEFLLWFYFLLYTKTLKSSCILSESIFESLSVAFTGDL